MSSNRLVIEVTVLAVGQRRFTPAGIPVIDCLLQHVSQQNEAGSERDVELEIEAVAIGRISDEVNLLSPGQIVRLAGFLARKRKSAKALVLHLTEVIQ